MFLNNYLSKVGSPILTIALFAVVKKSKGTWNNVSEYLWSIMQNIRVVTPIHITLTELSSWLFHCKEVVIWPHRKLTVAHS